MSFWWSLALLALPIAGALTTPDVRLDTAWARGDFDELARIGQGVSARGLEPALAGDVRERRLAALAAAPAAEDSWHLLLPLAGLAAGPDRSLAVAAARSGLEIVAELESERALELELPPDALARRLEAWKQVGAAADRWPDVRVQALEISARLAVVSRGFGYAAAAPFDLGARLADAEPEVRRAAAELAPQPLPQPALALLAQVVRQDEDAVVVAAAAQALCGGLAFGDAAEPVLAALGDAGMARIRALVDDATAPAVAKLDAARCLAAAGKPADLRALRGFVSRAPASIRRDAAALAPK